jgi:SulP family sulfate permease
VNFVSDAVVVGFTGGAGLLIIAGQISTLLRVSPAQTPDMVGIITALAPQLPQAHLPTLAVGLAMLALVIALRFFKGRLPVSLVAIVVVTAIVWALQLQAQGVRVLGEVPSGLPPLAPLGLLDLATVGQLSTGALAIAAIGLVEATAITRALASNSGERPDSNQEFIGQGMANIAAGLFSGYPCSASFNRSALCFRAGARTSLVSVFAGVFVLIASFVLAPLVAQLPRAVIAAELVLAAWGMIDRRRIARIWRGARGDATIMVVTLLATLLLPLQFAVLAGILMSLAYYILQTSTPQVLPVVPDAQFRHWTYDPGRPECPQLAVVDVLGDLYFGAVGHVETSIRRHMAAHPDQRYLLLRMHSVQRCDISGIHVLESLLRSLRARGGGLFMVRVREPVLQVMQHTGFYALLGADHFLSEDIAIGYLFHKVIDPAVCIYECSVRTFRECQNLPKREVPLDVPEIELLAAPGPREVTPRELWSQLRSPAPPHVVDVREPREFRQGHVPGAQLVPLGTLLSDAVVLPRDQPLVLVCRSGRRSARAAAALAARGYATPAVLRGGMLNWQADALLEAVD